jgi:hypothetical protein
MGNKATFVPLPATPDQHRKLPIARIYRITFRHDGKWQGLEEGSDQPLIVTHTQELAEEAVFEKARELGNARVLIYNGNNEVTQERTFAEAPRKDRGSWD